MLRIYLSYRDDNDSRQVTDVPSSVDPASSGDAITEIIINRWVVILNLF
jgi:hypothetical protein